MSLAQLAKARDSKFKPFPPQNAWLHFDFSQFRRPSPEDVRAAIAQVADRMLNPPIANIGVRGIRKAGLEIQKWPKLFSGNELRGNLFSIYIFIHIGGTGSGIFRYMYGRFLEEAAGITGIEELKQAAGMMEKCGDWWTEVALRFKDAMEVADPAALIEGLPEQLNVISTEEEKVFELLREVVA
ncbi:MAG TPA: DUF4872 domain-containing protein [Bacillota bacterium]|nr:DUF4872 domain-containing protein [Bacillota bacterium]